MGEGRALEAGNTSHKIVNELNFVEVSGCRQSEKGDGSAFDKSTKNNDPAQKPGAEEGGEKKDSLKQVGFRDDSEFVFVESNSTPQMKAQEYLDGKTDDPRRNLDPKDRETIKAMEKAILSGDLDSLEKIVQSFDKDYDEGQKLVGALGRDLEDAGIFAAYRGGGKLSVSDIESRTDVVVSSDGSTEAHINGSKVRPKDAFAKIASCAVESVNKLIEAGPDKLDSDVQSLLDKWTEKHSKSIAGEGDTINLYDGATLKDNGDGTCVAKREFLGDLNGTVAKDPKTGNVTYTLQNGVTYTRSDDGKIVTRTPADSIFPARERTQYANGLEVRNDGRLLLLPSGARISESEDGSVHLQDNYGDHFGTVTRSADGSKEYFFDDGKNIFTVKQSGEVRKESYGTTTIWAPDGAKAEIDRSKDISIGEKFKSTASKDTFEAVNGFKAERTEKGFKTETEKGTYDFDVDGNLKFTGKDGTTKEYKVTDAERVTYGHGSTVELLYPDGTCMTLSGKDIYASFSGPGDKRHHFWMEGGNSDVYYQLGTAGHWTPNYYPLHARG